MTILDVEYQRALTEIGEITPFWSGEDNLFVFEHDLYPAVFYLAETHEKTIKGYKQTLKSFIEDRLKGQLAQNVEQLTVGRAGRGGKRVGAGRPRKHPTRLKRLPMDVAAWLSDDENLKIFRQIFIQSSSSKKTVKKITPDIIEFNSYKSIKA